MTGLVENEMLASMFRSVVRSSVQLAIRRLLPKRFRWFIHLASTRAVHQWPAFDTTDYGDWQDAARELKRCWELSVIAPEAMQAVDLMFRSPQEALEALWLMRKNGL